MNAVECIKTRRSVRKFTDEMVSVDTVREIVELASYAAIMEEYTGYQIYTCGGSGDHS